MKQLCDGAGKLFRQNLRIVKTFIPELSKQQLSILRDLTDRLKLSVLRGEFLCLEGKWYVTHPGLLRIAHRKRCAGIQTQLEYVVSTPLEGRWVFKATVHKTPSKMFVG